MKMKPLLTGAALALITALGVTTASATTYTYVGSWTLGDGPVWTTNPPVYSGVETAALLFGGTASDYVISTVDANPADVNFKTWLDGWGDPFTYASSGNPAPDTYSLDTGGSGYDSNPGYQSAYSAYVADHFNPAFNSQDPSLVNYAFSISGTPEPATWAMMLVGFGGIGAAMRSARRKQAIVAA
jgi:hypothetical protein